MLYRLKKTHRRLSSVRIWSRWLLNRRQCKHPNRPVKPYPNYLINLHISSNLSKSTISWIQKESFHRYNLNVDVINVEVRRSDFAKVSFYSASVPDGIRGDILSPVMDVPDMAWPLRLFDNGHCLPAIDCSRHSIATSPLPWVCKLGTHLTTFGRAPHLHWG